MCIIGYGVCSTLGSPLEENQKKSGGAAAELGLSKAKGPDEVVSVAGSHHTLSPPRLRSKEMTVCD